MIQKIKDKHKNYSRTQTNSLATENSRYSKNSNCESIKSHRRSSSYICRNCYNLRRERPIYLNGDIENTPYKQKLINSFIKDDPNLFQNKMEQMKDNKINDKVNRRLNRTKSAVNFLSNFQIKNPTEIEKFQRLNESSPSTIFDKCGGKDPRYLRLKQRSDQIERCININNNGINEPRQAYKDYFNKAMYNSPMDYGTNERSVYNLLKDGYLDDLKRQIEEKRRREKEQREQERLNEQKLNENLKALNDRDRNQEEHKKDLIKQIKEENLRMARLKQEKKDIERQNLLESKLLADKEAKQAEDNERLLRQRKKDEEKQNYYDWKKINDSIKKNRKDEESKEPEKWKNAYNKNYQEEITVNCQHGNDLMRCAICKRCYPKDKLIKVHSK